MFNVHEQFLLIFHPTFYFQSKEYWTYYIQSKLHYNCLNIAKVTKGTEKMHKSQVWIGLNFALEISLHAINQLILVCILQVTWRNSSATLTYVWSTFPNFNCHFLVLFPKVLTLMHFYIYQFWQKGRYYNSFQGKFPSWKIVTFSRLSRGASLF